MSRLWRNVLLYGLGAVLTRGLQFILLPLYTRCLEPTDYGGLEMLQIVSSVLSVVFGLMIASGFIRCFYDSSDERDRAALLGTSLTFILLSTIALLIPFVFASDRIAHMLGLAHAGGAWLVLTALTCGVSLLSRVLYNELMVRERVVRYVVASLLALAIALSLSVWFVARLRWGVTGVLGAQLIGSVAEFVILAVVVRGTVIRWWSTEAASRMLRFSVALIPLQIAVMLLLLSDRFFLSHFASLEQVGQYAVGCRFAGLIVLLVVEPMRAFGPYVFSMIDDPARCKQAIADMARHVLGAGVLVSLVLALFSPELVRAVAGNGYAQGASVVFLLCLTQAFYAFFNVTCFALNIVKKNWFISIAWAVAAAASIAINMWAVPTFGMVAAAATVCICHAGVSISILLYIARVYPVPFEYKRLAGLVAFAIIVYAVAVWLPCASPLLSNRIGLGLAFMSVMFFSGYLSPTEWRALADLGSTLLRIKRK